MNMAVIPLRGEWARMFKAPAAELTEYARTHPLHLKRVRITDEDISESTFHDARFDNVYWNDVIAQDGAFLKASFRGGQIHYSSFAGARLTDVLFEDVTLDDVEFNQARMQNVTFRNCRITNSRFYGVQASNLVIEDSELKDVGFYDATVDLRLRKTRIVEAGLFRGLKEGSTVEIDHSYVGIYSDLATSSLASLIIRNSRFRKTRANFSTIDKLIVSGSDTELSIAGSTFGEVSYQDSGKVVLGSTPASHSRARSITISRCRNRPRMLLDDMTIGRVDIRDCEASLLALYKSVAERITLANVTADVADLGKIQARELVLHNFTVTGKLDLTGARAEAVVIHQLRISPGAEVLTEGSNIDLTR